MAERVVAVNAYRPRIVHGNYVELKDMVEYISDRTGLNKGDLLIALSELEATIGFFSKRGEPVRLPGLGVIKPLIGLDGTIKFSFRTDKDLLSAINADGAFHGEILNRDNIGKSTDALVGLWNEAHPDDLVE